MAIVNIHLIQNVPPSNLNRDDSGAPKTATYGGVVRSRLSSQSVKRAMREFTERTGSISTERAAVRTKHIVDEIVREYSVLSPETDPAEALKIVAAGMATTKIKLDVKKGNVTGYLLFVGTAEIKAAAAALKADPKANLGAIIGKSQAPDVALFGRMIAEETSMNVEAAAQVAHAISTHAVDNEFDFFTAVDDVKDDLGESAGAGMIGTIEFNSSTLYRYANVNIGDLAKNLGTDSADVAAQTRAFIEAFVKTLPSGKQNTFAAHSLPSVVLVSVREDQPISYASAFESAVEAEGNSGYVAESARRLSEHHQELEAMYGTGATFVLATSEATKAGVTSTVSNLTELLDAVSEAIA